MQWVSRTYNLSKDLLSNFFTTSISRRLRPDLSNASEYDKCGKLFSSNVSVHVQYLQRVC